MKLVIAEKPSVARRIASAVGARNRRDGYIEGADWIVTWCRGHLVDLAAPEEYPGWNGPWDAGKLPMVPGEWRWRQSGEDGAAALLTKIGELAARPDVDTVVNACDADREGEGIFRRVAGYLGIEKPVLRLWSTSLEDDAIRRDLARMKPGSAYDGLAASAEGRAEADWLVGLNATRAYTCLYRPRSALSVGRVQTPVLAMVVERTRAAASFKSVPFWRVSADLGAFRAATLRISSREEAEALLARIGGSGEAVVTKAEYRDDAMRPPALYDLTALQRDASMRCGLTAEQSLAALQALYEKGLATYPRTDSRKINSEDAGSAEGLLARVAAPGIVGAAAAEAFDSSRADISRVVDDSKVSGHGALMPTAELDAAAMASLPHDERQVALLICCRLLSATMPPGRRRKAKVELDAGGVPLEASSSHVVDPSWSAVDGACTEELCRLDRELKEAAGAADGERLPEGISPGDGFKVLDASVERGQTAPPRLYTDASLLAAMEHAGRAIDGAALRAAIDDDSTHSGGLGTPATRASIIEKLIARGYMERRGKAIASTDLGGSLIDLVDPSLKTPELTARWEASLSAVERGEVSLERFRAGIARYTEHIVAAAKAGYDPSGASGLSGDREVGRCPLCGAPVIDRGPGSRSYACSANTGRCNDDGKWVPDDGACPFSIWKRVAGKLITPAQAAALLEHGRTAKIKGFTSKAGRKFEARLILVPGEAGRVAFEFERGGRKRPGGGRTG